MTPEKLIEKKLARIEDDIAVLTKAGNELALEQAKARRADLRLLRDMLAAEVEAGDRVAG